MYLLPTSIPFSLNKYTLSHTLIAQTRTKATDMFISYVFPIGNTKYHTRSSDYPTIGTLTYSTEDTLDHFEICFMLLVALNGYFINRTIIFFFLVFVFSSSVLNHFHKAISIPCAWRKMEIWVICYFPCSCKLFAMEWINPIFLILLL